MPSSDHILSFALSAVLHLLGLLLIGSQVWRVNPANETPPELEVTSVELALAGIETAPASAAPEGSSEEPQETPLQPLDMPRTEEPPPPPTLPEKPAFAEALTPPPEPLVEVTEPKATPQPAPPLPAPVQRAPAPAGPMAIEKPAAAPAGDAADKTVIQPANGGTSGRIDAHPSLNRPIKPNYPIGSRRRGEEGTVILDITVDEDGNAKAVSLVTGSGFPELDAAAERAAAHARFKPGTRTGRPVESAARITIIFRLRDS